MIVLDMEAEDFLELVWGSSDRSRGGGVWVDLPAKVGEYWVPWHHQWEGEADAVITRRIDSCLRDGESLYFSVGTFSRRGRKDSDALPTCWLWADLDEVHPTSLAKAELLPTIAWESSPGRYQALWRLNRAVSPKVHRRVNQALSYHCGADHGGWDLTQVLRLPGTRNFKYPGGPPVRLLWHHEELSYRAAYIWEIVGASLPVGLVPSGDSDTGDERAVRPMPQRVRSLLSVPPGDVVEGERSSKLWAIECGLAEVGWSEEQIYVAVVDSAWNKWQKLGTGERRLRDEIRKALHHVARKEALGRKPGTVDTPALRSGDGDEEPSPPQEGVGDTGDSDGDATLALPWVAYSSFMAMEMPEPKWLIEDIWTAQSHGIFGGEPKTSKTTLSLALALSVASGCPFLGKYPVRTPGPVLFIQEENAPWMVQDRLRKIAAMYGMIQPRRVSRAAPGALGATVVELDFPAEAPLQLLNNFGVDLTDEAHREALWAHAEQMSPALIIIDPMYLVLAGVDYDRARDLAPYLKWILALRNEVGCAVMLVHHFSKTPQGGSGSNGAGRRHGQRLLGSTTFHGFLDSGLYAEQTPVDEAGWVGCRLEREFRSMAPQGALDIALMLGDVGALDMECKVGAWNLQQAIEDLVRESAGITAVQVAGTLGIDKRTVLGRARDSTVVGVLSGRKGRGHSHRLFLKDDLPENEHTK